MSKLKLFFSFLVIILILSGCKDEFKNKKEVRAIWMSRFDIVGKGAGIESIKNNIINTFTKARDAKFNMIIYQVRGNGDAFYKSAFEPWSKILTGTLGKDPGWDPLEFALETAHSLGLELHVWVNTFPAWRVREEKPTESIPRHILLQHPEWIICDLEGKTMYPDEGYISISPGIPEVREHITNVVMDIVRKYDIDGVHFDYIRYPEGANKSGYSHDAISVQRYKSEEGNPNKLDWPDWQREQINEFVRNVYDSINSVKPWVKMSASVIGNYNKTAWNGYNVVYQDPKKWMTENKIDFIVPMTYLRLGDEKSPFESAINDWKTMLTMRDIYPGLYASKASQKGGWGWEMIWDEIKLLRETGFPGFAFFAMSSLMNVWDEIKNAQFPYFSNIPEFRYKNSGKPPIPKNIYIRRKNENVITITWDNIPNDKNGQPYYYNIYRSKNKNMDFSTAQNLIYVTKRGQNTYIDSTAGMNYYYSISALNRDNVEGDHSEIKNIVELLSANK
jgi:uncharacterized lipoprotein YddW (UPF0748 family)